MELTDNLISYWKLDGNSTDSVGSNNGTDTDVSYTSLLGVDTGISPDSSLGTSYIGLGKFTAIRTGTVTNFRLKAQATGNVKVAIYADNAGNPGTLITANNTPQACSVGWNSLSIASTSITAGTVYHLAVISDAQVCQILTSGGATTYKSQTYSGYNWESTISGLSSVNYTLAVSGWDLAYGKINQGAGFNGTTSKKTLSYNNIGSTLSYSAWVKSTNSGSQVILSFMSTILLIDAGGVDWWADSGQANIIANSTVTDGKWHHIVITQSGINYIIYLDGAVLKSGTTSAVNTTNSSNIIGTYATSGWIMNGSIDEVGIWSRALTAQEVAQLYNFNNGLPYPLVYGSGNMFLMF